MLDAFEPGRRTPMSRLGGVCDSPVLGHTAAAPLTSVIKSRAHSITSSAVASRDGGTLRPSILAVSALMTSSNFEDCTTGRSAGLGPLRILPTYKPTCRHASALFAP